MKIIDFFLSFAIIIVALSIGLFSYSWPLTSSNLGDHLGDQSLALLIMPLVFTPILIVIGVIKIILRHKIDLRLKSKWITIIVCFIFTIFYNGLLLFNNNVIILIYLTLAILTIILVIIDIAYSNRQVKSKERAWPLDK